MNEPKVLTRMRLCCCWGDNLNEKELNEVVDYINQLQNNWNKLKNCVIDLFNRSQDITYLDVLEKMQELEQGKDGI